MTNNLKNIYLTLTILLAVLLAGCSDRNTNPTWIPVETLFVQTTEAAELQSIAETIMARTPSPTPTVTYTSTPQFQDQVLELVGINTRTPTFTPTVNPYIVEFKTNEWLYNPYLTEETSVRYYDLRDPAQFVAYAVEVGGDFDYDDEPAEWLKANCELGWVDETEYSNYSWEGFELGKNDYCGGLNATYNLPPFEENTGIAWIRDNKAKGYFLEIKVMGLREWQIADWYGSDASIQKWQMMSVYYAGELDRQFEAVRRVHITGSPMGGWKVMGIGGPIHPDRVRMSFADWPTLVPGVDATASPTPTITWTPPAIEY